MERTDRRADPARPDDAATGTGTGTARPAGTPRPDDTGAGATRPADDRDPRPRRGRRSRTPEPRDAEPRATRRSRASRGPASPGTRPAGGPPPRSSERFVEPPGGTDPRARPGDAAPAPTRTGRFAGWWDVWGPHIRRFAPTVLVNHAVTVALIVVVAVVIGIGVSFSVVPAAIGAMWMLSTLAPVGFSGQTLGVAPFLPAALIALGHAHRVRAACGSTVTVRNLRVFGALSVLVPVVLTLVAWFMLWDVSSVYRVEPPNLAVAELRTVVLHGLVFVAGLGPRIWRALLIRRGLPAWPVESVRLAGSFLSWMAVAGLVVVVVRLVANLSSAGAAYGVAAGAVGATGLTVLSLLYLPTLVIGAVAVLMGGEFHIGQGVTTLFGVTNVNLPPLPVLAAVPNEDVPLGPAWLAVTAAVAIAVVYRFIRGREFLEAPVATAVGAGVVSGVVALVVSWLAGGQLGVYGHTGALVWMAGAEAAGWLLVPAVVLMLFMVRQGTRVTEEIADAPAAGVAPAPGEGDDADLPAAPASAGGDADARGDSAADVAADADADADTDADAESEAGSDVDAEAGSDADADVNGDVDANADADSDADADVNGDADADGGIHAVAATDADGDAATGGGPEDKAQGGVGTPPGTAVPLSAVSDPDAVAPGDTGDTEETEAEHDPDSDPDPDSDAPDPRA
ncbi:DUF6350 family protein [Corynebacterium bovis]|uniref:cell division protein PerM n=2 Tax=Corynebacterium bovis TaxID=36808 RepID=UPI003139F198